MIRGKRKICNFCNMFGARMENSFWRISKNGNFTVDVEPIMPQDLPINQDIAILGFGNILGEMNSFTFTSKHRKAIDVAFNDYTEFRGEKPQRTLFVLMTHQYGIWPFEDYQVTCAETLRTYTIAIFNSDEFETTYFTVRKWLVQRVAWLGERSIISRLKFWEKPPEVPTSDAVDNFIREVPAYYHLMTKLTLGNFYTE